MKTTAIRALSLVLATGLGLLACAKESAPSAAQRYTVRGEIVRISAAGEGKEISIRHEAIPDFRDRTGAVVGMMAMVMPFPVKKGLSLDGLSPGDKVRFRFAMDFAAAKAEVESIERLPPETVLDFALGAR